MKKSILIITIILIISFIGCTSDFGMFFDDNDDYNYQTYDEYETQETVNKQKFYGKATLFKAKVNKDSQVKHSNLYSVTYEDETDFHYFNDMDDKVFLMVDILDGSGLYPNIAVCWDMDGEFLPFIIMKIGSNDWEFVISFENHMLEAYLVGSIKDRKGVVGYIVNGDYFLFGIESSNNVVTERNYHPLYNGECVSRDDTTNAEGSNYLLGLGYETSGYVLANNKINPDSKGIHSIITNINDLETVLIKNNIDNSIQ